MDKRYEAFCLVNLLLNGSVNLLFKVSTLSSHRCA